MSIENDIIEMYEKRFERREIPKPASKSTVYQHQNNIIKLHTEISMSPPKLFGQMNWLETKSATEIHDIIKVLPGRKGPIGVATQRQYLTSVLVALRVIDFAGAQDRQLFKDISDLLNGSVKAEIETYREISKNQTAETMPSYDSVMALTEKYIGGSQGDLDTKIILRIYTTYPIRLEAADLIYIDSFAKYTKMKKGILTQNYIVAGKKKILFSFSDYKTADRYGTAEIVVKDKMLKRLLHEKVLLTTPDTSLFGITRKALSKRITDFFDRNEIPGVSPTLLAKIIETNAFHSMPEDMRNKMKNMAEFRKHSLDTQMKFYVH
tara:strand:+ start:1912 stop:2877 length:966 start_codon:yes stop_codon:yes gene_type:complete